MVYVTGDTHGAVDLGKLLPGCWPEGQCLTRDDCLVVCGDFGAVWDLGRRDERLLEWWESQPWTTLFVDGNHENHDALDGLPVTERFGAPAQVVTGYPHVIHLMRGYVYDLPITAEGGARCLVMGGAASVDRELRVEGESWWAREMPSEEEYERCTASLEASNWQVNFMLTHELPCDLRAHALGWTRFASLFGGADRLSNYLQWVYDSLDKDALRMWYAGHYHTDAMVSDRCRVLYQDVVPMGVTVQGR